MVVEGPTLKETPKQYKGCNKIESFTFQTIDMYWVHGLELTVNSLYNQGRLWTPDRPASTSQSSKQNSVRGRQKHFGKRLQIFSKMSYSPDHSAPKILLASQLPSFLYACQLQAEEGRKHGARAKPGIRERRLGLQRSPIQAVRCNHQTNL